MCTVLCFLCPSRMSVDCEHTICAVCESADGTPQNALFLSSSGSRIATGEQSSARPLLRRSSLSLEVRRCVFAPYACRRMCICLCSLPGINSVGRVPAGDSAYKTMAVPGPPLLILLSLLLPLLLSKASLPAAANTLTPRRQPQHKLLHLGEGARIREHGGSW